MNARSLIPAQFRDQQSGSIIIGEKDAEFRPLFAQIEKQIETLVDYRKSLIHECVTGQRRVSEADLRPACSR